MSSPYINQTKREHLRDMKVFVLDNSLRESTVAQPAGHTLNDKYKILEQIKACGFQDVIVGAFGSDRRVDDAFCENLKEAFSGADAPSRTYAFSEVSEKFIDGKMMFGEECIPTGLQKMKKYGINNAIIEIDLDTTYIDWDGNFCAKDAVDGIGFLTKWALSNLQQNCRNFVNL